MQAFVYLCGLVPLWLRTPPNVRTASLERSQDGLTLLLVLLVGDQTVLA